MADYNRRYNGNGGRSRSANTNRSRGRDYNNVSNRRNTSYIHGNTVTAPEYETSPRKTRVYREGRRVNDTKRGIRYIENKQHLTFGYTFFMILLVAGVLGMSIISINIDNQITRKQKKINSLQQEINMLTSENEIADYQINSCVDTDAIIKTAKKELGMVEAKDDQISYFKKSSSEYMKQLKDIPKE